MKLKKLPYALLCLYGPLTTSLAFAEKTLEPVVVIGRSEDQVPSLRESAGSASRLGLTVRETPASVEVLTQDVIERRGARSLDEALRGAVGVTPGGNATSPSQASTRGFTSGFVTYLYDGNRVSVPTMSGRTQDTWNYERIEVLKGPASIMYGEGSIGGAINFVTKRPDRSHPVSEASLSYGSFGTWRAGVGINRPISESSALRIDYSYQKTDGYVDRNKQQYDNLTMAFTTALSRDVTLDLSLDTLKDDIKSYQGTPLVPRSFATEPADVVSDSAGRVVDRRLAFKNYNTDDAVMEADSVWARAKLGWQISPEWKLRNELSYYTADRRWRNSESYAFTAPQQLTRDLVGVTHDHQVLTNRLDLTHNGKLAGMKNRFAAGFEYTRTDFATERRFSNGSAVANAALTVDIFNPVHGSYKAFSNNPALYSGAGNRTNFQTRIPTLGLFAEDALSLGEKWTVVAGLRQDRITLERETFDLNTNAAAAFSQKYRPRSARLGTVYAADKDTSFYAQYTNATAPVGSGNLLLLSAANAAFELSKGTQVEIGVKQSLLDGRIDYTIAAYKIVLDNILSRDAAVPTLTVNSGQQSSRGLELAAAWRATRRLSISGNLALVDAEFDRLIEAGNVSRAGNVPPNVARKMANLWLDYKVQGVPLTLGTGLNYTGDRYTNNANTVKMNAYTTADAYASWDLKPGSLTLRVRNVTDKLYASWSGANANNQVMMGAPRSVDITYRIAF